ncbi:DNA-binding MarR family transcriptional regulator [Streptomyces sp. SAI-170]|uniref:helix-turn-helix domain-containing protein n=1 Tax=Streptomyces sp. SAI-170 TaxID=3377729 RepID=UPI003C7D9F33
MTTTAAPSPALTPRSLALAHYAARAVLERVLARYGTTFQQSVTLRLLAVAEGPVTRDAVVADAVAALKVPEPEIEATLDELIDRGLAGQDGSALRITDAGRELYTTTSAATAPISARIYAGIPPEDLAAAGRVLAQVAERANAELAALEAAEQH